MRLQKLVKKVNEKFDKNYDQINPLLIEKEN